MSIQFTGFVGNICLGYLVENSKYIFIFRFDQYGRVPAHNRLIDVTQVLHLYQAEVIARALREVLRPDGQCDVLHHLVLLVPELWG